MNRSQAWLAVALLAAVLLIPASRALARSVPPRVASVALSGLDLGVLASVGAPPESPSSGSSLPARPPAGEETPIPAAAPSPTQALPAPAPRQGKLIFIDAGHGGVDAGAVHTTATGEVDLLEKEANLSIALTLAGLLRQAGYDVQLARTTDSSVAPGASSSAELQARMDLANQAGAALYVAVHHNGHSDTSLRGTEVYYCSARPSATQNIRLARLIQEALVRSLRQAGYATVDRGIKDDVIRGHLAVLGPLMARPNQMPAIMGEALFVTNDEDAAQLQRADIREAFARGYLEGIQAYFAAP